MRLTALLALATCLCTACVGAPPPPPNHSDGSYTAEPSDPTSTGPTTLGEGTTGTVATTGLGSSRGSTTVGASATDATTATDDTTQGGDSSTSGGGPPPECALPSDCDSNETCSGMGQCVDACGGAWGVGSYGYCLDPSGQVDIVGQCGTGHSCLIEGAPAELATCLPQGCATACDCPPPPGTGNAVVACDQLTVSDMVTDCFLDCGSGEACPDGMVCHDGLLQTYCAHPAEPPM